MIGPYAKQEKWAFVSIPTADLKMSVWIMPYDEWMNQRQRQRQRQWIVGTELPMFYVLPALELTTSLEPSIDGTDLSLDEVEEALPLNKAQSVEALENEFLVPSPMALNNNLNGQDFQDNIIQAWYDPVGILVEWNAHLPLFPP